MCRVPSTRGHLGTLVEEMALTIIVHSLYVLVAGGFQYPTATGVGGRTGSVAAGAKAPKPG